LSFLVLWWMVRPKYASNLTVHTRRDVRRERNTLIAPQRHVRRAEKSPPFERDQTTTSARRALADHPCALAPLWRRASRDVGTAPTDVLTTGTSRSTASKQHIRQTFASRGDTEERHGGVQGLRRPSTFRQKSDEWARAPRASALACRNARSGPSPAMTACSAVLGRCSSRNASRKDVDALLAAQRPINADGRVRPTLASPPVADRCGAWADRVVDDTDVRPCTKEFLRARST